MERLALTTPVFRSARLDAELGLRLHFKMDCLQPTRSFKLRGMEHVVRHHMAAGRRLFVGSSGGNAGYSLAYACRRLGAEARVFVPATTLPAMRARVQAEGAQVTVVGESWMEAHMHAMRVADELGAAYVPPFDDPLLWAGHASMIMECAAEMPEPDWVVAAVGGGGLLCGIMEGMEQAGWNRAAMLAAETEGAASYARSLAAGELVTLDAIDTIATSLGAKRVAEEALAWSRRRRVESHICTDAQAMQGVRQLLDLFGTLVEPACGAALSAVWDRNPRLEQGQDVLVIVCGGVGLDTAGYLEQLRRFGLLA